MSVTAPASASASSAPPRSDRRLPGLDGLRGLAVAWVLAFHLWPDVVRGGWLGVGLFFTLSGYLIAGLIDAEVTSTGRLRLGRFMARRVRRLLPAALVTIAATLALTALLDDQPLRTIGIDALTAALNVFNWHASLDEAGYAGIFEAAPAPLEHFWSLAIEEQFYLVFPAAVALIRRPGRVVAAMAIIGLAGVWLWWGSTDAYVATPVRALEIAAGAGLAVAQARYGVVQRLFRPPADASRRSRIVWAVLLAVVAVLTAVTVLRLGPEHDLVFRSGPQLMALCWVVLVIAAVRDGWPARFMSWAPLRWLGLRSYAIYLFHWPVIELTDWHPVVVIAVTLGLAEASFHLLEMPVRRGTGRRAIGVLAGAAAAVVAVSAVAAAASTPARGIAERAQGADELPAWLTEQDAPEAAAETPSPAGTDAASDAGDDATASPASSSESAASSASPTGASDQPEADNEAPSSESGDADNTDDPSASVPQPSDAPAPAEQDAPDETGDGSTDGTGVDVPENGSADDTGEAAPAEGSEDSAGQDPIGEEPPPDTAPATTVPQTGLPVPIVTVLGDSTAVHIADGLRKWADSTRSMAVLDHSRVGCSPAAFPASSWRAFRGNLSDVEATPSGFMPDIPCRDDYFEPGSAVILVVDHGAVLFDHLRADGTWASILDPDLETDVIVSYRQLVDRASAAGAQVVFTTAPPMLAYGREKPENQPQTDPARAVAYNALISDLVLELNRTGAGSAALIETAALIEESGRQGTYGRSDGMHVDYEKAELLAAELLGPALLALLGLS